MANSAENVDERIGKLETSRRNASKQMNELENKLNMNAEPFTPAQQWWPQVDYSQYSVPSDYGMGFGASPWGWDPTTLGAVDPLQILAARVTDLERYKDEAAIHLKKLKERVEKLEKQGVLQPPASKSKSKDLQRIEPPPGLTKPPGIDTEADTSASDSDAQPRALSGVSSSDDEMVRSKTDESEDLMERNMEKILEEGSDDDDEPSPPQPGAISRAASEVISFTRQPDNAVCITWLITNFRAKMVKQLGRASVSPCINDAEGEITDARILISPLGSIDKMPRSRKEKAAYTKTVEQGPFCPYLQLKVPSKQTITFCFMLGNKSSEKQTHDFSSAPMSSQVKIEPQKDWLKSINDGGDLTLTLKIFM